METDNNFILELSSPQEEHATNFQHICSKLFLHNEFVDCTLCCSDGQLQAHRVILASTSNYMYNMLSTTPWPTPCSHPMLFFKSFSVNDMKLAMEYIYTGKAKVSRNKLPILMDISRELGCSSLSKAIEKGIHSCGVEIFRKRIQTQSVTNSINKSTSPTYLAATSLQNRAFIANNQPNVSISSTPFQHQTKEAVLLAQNESHEFPQSTDSLNDDDEGVSPHEVKTEPEENMMLELDPCSIATSIDPTTLVTSNHSSSEFSPSGDVAVKVDHNLQFDANNRSLEMQQDVDNIIKMKDKDNEDITNITDDREENGIDVDDDHGQDEEDEEEMPITVVDLKSLAETGTDVDTDAVALSSLGIGNMDTLPANCPWCFQVFTSLTLLQRHIKTHVGNYKPYSCQYCPASFARSAHLKRHIRTHTGEKPFVCSFCSRAFSRQDKLKTHLEKHLLDQHLQNNAKFAATTCFPPYSQNNACLNRSNTVATTSTPSTTTVTGLSPHKQIMQTISTSTNLSQCLPLSSPAYQYFINDGSEIWQTQADRISKGLLGVPGQITVSTTSISPSTTITPIPSLLVHTNPPPL